MRLIDKILIESQINEAKVINFKNRYGNMVIMMGSPGAGKSFTINTVVNLSNYKILSSDSFIEMIAKKNNIDLKNPDETVKLHVQHSSKAKKFRDNWIKNQNGKKELPNVIIDITGGNVGTINKLSLMAKDVGYETTLIYVVTHIDQALKRNKERPRSVPDDVVINTYHEVNKAYHETFEKFDYVWLKYSDKIWSDLDDQGKFSRPYDHIIKVK